MKSIHDHQVELIDELQEFIENEFEREAWKSYEFLTVNADVVKVQIGQFAYRWEVFYLGEYPHEDHRQQGTFGAKNTPSEVAQKLKEKYDDLQKRFPLG